MKVTVFSGANLAVATNEVLKTARENVGLAPTFIIVPDRFTLQAERILLSNGNNPFHKREMQEKQKDNEERMCQQPDNVHENLDDGCHIDGDGVGGDGVVGGGGSGGGGIGGSGGGGDGVGVGAVGGGDGGDGVGAVGGGGGSGGAMLNTRVVTFSMLFSVLADELTGGREVNIIDKTTAVL
ncbi:MAG: hypothetical protein LBQ05_01530, partial [Christensenellaceae bacterium]|nr:hypothetical protein [Christensenellaceae bacterium]